MKGIYLTEEGKKEIEAEIKELEYKKSFKSDNNNIWYFQGRIDLLKEILSSATILPLEHGYDEFYYNSNEYPNGVIIQPKQ